MSDLEALVSPILRPMILGEERTLPEADQRIVAFWAAKMGMVLEYTQPRKQRGIPRAHREYVYNHRAAPPTLYVSLAAYTGPPQGPICFQTHYTLWGKDEPALADDAPPNTYTAAFGVGQLVFEIFGHVIATNVVFNEGPGTMCIWPESRGTRRWPPRITLRTEADLMQFGMNLMTGSNVPRP